MPNLASFRHWQSRLPYTLGVPIEALRDLRKAILVEGEDWVTTRGRVMLTDGAVLKLRVSLKLAPPPEVGARIDSKPAAGPPPPPAVSDAPTGRLVIKATAPHVRNRVLVVVVRESEFADPKAREWVMRVRDNALFGVNRFVEEGDYAVEGDGTLVWVGRYPPRRGYYD